MAAKNSNLNTGGAQVHTTRSCAHRARPYYQSVPYAEAMRRAKLPPGAQLLFQELVRRSGRRGYTWALQGELADHLDVTTRTIRRWEGLLAKAGLVTLGRCSFWARRRKGGVRRVAVPHLYNGEGFYCPEGIMGDAKALLCDGRRVRAAAIRRRVTKRAPISSTQAAATFYMKEKTRPVDLETVTKHPKRATVAAYLVSAVGWVREQGEEMLVRYGWTREQVLHAPA